MEAIAVCRMLMQTLRSQGLIPSNASNIQEARNALLQEAYDLVILDAAASGMDGRDLCWQIKQGKYGGLCLALMHPAGWSPISALPADGLLTKPVRALRLRALLIDLLSPEAEK